MIDKSFKHFIRYALMISMAMALLWYLPGLLTGSPAQPGTSINAAAAGDPVIAAAGDIACDPGSSAFNGGLGTSSSCRQLYTSNLLVNAGLTAVLDLGDNQYYCGSDQAFNQSYDLSWGRVKSITHPSVGNHEYLTSGGTGCNPSNAGAAGYFKYFGSAAGTPGEGYYSYNVGAWHLIALNSNCGNVGGCGSGSPQYTWLQSDLKANPNECILAYWHIPLFSSGGRAAPNSQPFWNLLYAAHADLILNGHDHIYERFAPQNPSGGLDTTNGIVEIISGTGGADHTSLSTIAANSLVRNTTTYGVLKLTLHASSYDFQFVPEAGQTFTDSGSAACHNTTAAAPTSTPTPLPTATSTPQPVATNTPTPNPVATNTPTPNPVATNTPTALPTATPTPGAAQTFTFVPVADTYVDSSNPTINYGSSTQIRTDGSPTVNSYIRFSVSGLTGTVTSVTLRIYPNSSLSSSINAMAVSDNTWGELSMTWNNAPPMGSKLTTSGTITAGTWIPLTVTGYITTDGTYSFGITDNSTTAESMASRESGANAEQLVIVTQ